MMTAEVWQAQNNVYLQTATAWIRLKLELAARAVERPVEIAAPSNPRPDEAPEHRWAFFRKSAPPSSTPVKPIPLLPAGTDPTSAEALKQLEEQLAAASAVDPAPALIALANQLRMSSFERDILLLCVVMELDTRVAGLLARAHDDPSKVYPTFAVAMTLFADPAWDALSPERPLRYWRLVEIMQHAAQPLTTSALRVDERIVSFIKGLNYIDDRLTPLIVPMPRTTVDELPPSQRTVAEAVVAQLRDSVSAVAPIALLGRDRECKRYVASAVASAMDHALYRLPIQNLPPNAAELETFARLWQRETILLPIALYVDSSDMDRAAGAANIEDAAARVPRFIARTGGLILIDAVDGAPWRPETLATIEVRKPTPAEQQAAWAAALAEDAGELPALLAGQFNLNRHDIESVVVAARRADESLPLATRVWRGSLARTRPTLDRLAEKIDAKARWEQLVLPAHELSLLHQIAAQVRERATVYDTWGFRSTMNRGLGISALFAGESGTGKTMAAEVLANELELDLYRIDLSAVVSKYIGETEKNLRQVFDAAEDGGAILLFDEADALFGKRSEVKDSHDRYANIEINYLLQRIESYRGLAILATNMKGALDSAFVRRLRFIINFSYPGVADRRRIWERAFPADVPLGVLDHQRLAKLNLTGGNIHSVAVSAAFLAASARTPISMNVVLDAARAELRKLERPINEADFRLPEVANGREARA